MSLSKKMMSMVVAVAATWTLSTATSFAADASLYDRLGGQGAIQAVVTKFIGNVGADKRINSYFATTDLKKLNKLLVEQVCAASGGPCTYSGRDMKTTHKGMKVTTAAFNALVEDLVSALDTFNVPAKEKGELLAVLGPMNKDIVEVP
ncbi:MAG: group 1 truncated hemoglobin [Nitrospira sp.]|jgi:hemoglobin|nr:group 1 truncated hemoglobin [Nitrospira sp.]TKB64171.1 MAG: group 1 truncated hemoglobin [Nitrospira sp.]TKB89452.1 MAG: group 1 truncated hemoglobin [Nitrospira sp.]